MGFLQELTMAYSGYQTLVNAQKTKSSAAKTLLAASQKAAARRAEAEITKVQTACDAGIEAIDKTVASDNTTAEAPLTAAQLKQNLKIKKEAAMKAMDEAYTNLQDEEAIKASLQDLNTDIDGEQTAMQAMELSFGMGGGGFNYSVVGTSLFPLWLTPVSFTAAARAQATTDGDPAAAEQAIQDSSGTTTFPRTPRIDLDKNGNMTFNGQKLDANSPQSLIDEALSANDAYGKKMNSYAAGSSAAAADEDLDSRTRSGFTRGKAVQQAEAEKSSALSTAIRNGAFNSFQHEGTA